MEVGTFVIYNPSLFPYRAAATTDSTTMPIMMILSRNTPERCTCDNGTIISAYDFVQIQDHDRIKVS